jgi:hybrid cluster-associated redox disulfide protein
LRQRKEEMRKYLYDGFMAGSISRDWTVGQTLKAYPQVVPVFTRLKTGCVGCWLERFCTLEDVGSHYGIQPEVLLDSLCRYVSSIDSQEEER